MEDNQIVTGDMKNSEKRQQEVHDATQCSCGIPPSEAILQAIRERKPLLIMATLDIPSAPDEEIIFRDDSLGVEIRRRVLSIEEFERLRRTKGIIGTSLRTGRPG